MICLAGTLLVTQQSTSASTTADDWPSPDAIDGFIVEMTEKHAFERDELVRLFAHLKPNRTVLKTIAPPTDPGVKSWQRYRARFLDQARIDNGVHFWNLHADTLKRAEESFGVPAEIIVAIIGVETEYGRNKGNFSVLDALSTIAFAYPPRQAFFRSELEQFLLLTRENRLAPEAIRGSYAGAIGIPQFMPGSQRRYAVDFDEDGRVDLMNSAPDAIGSVGRFLKLHGWVSGQNIVERTTVKIVEPTILQTLIDAGIRPSLNQEKLESMGISADHRPALLPAAMIDLVSPEGATEYWWGFENFYVITRYNRSSFYAMSVVQLAEAIRTRRADGRPLTSGNKKAPKEGSRAKRHRAG